MTYKPAFLAFVCWALLSSCATSCNKSFPEGFLFGAGSSAYQVEGAWDTDGKGESIWDHLIHTRPDYIQDRRNGDVACDSYNKYMEDVEILKDLGVDFYRFSISWTRILPNGLPNKINQKGIEYYNNLINALIENNITPMVTIYHWDLPQYLQNLGGFTNPIIVELFTQYAEILFREFGDRVKIWTTFNEPTQVCMAGYGDMQKAPALASSGILDYLCAHNLIKAHASAYHLYYDKFQATQNGKVGLVLDGNYAIISEESNENIDAQNRYLQFNYGIWAHPVFIGNYPEVLIKRIGERSAKEGFRKSRLPTFTTEEIEYIKGTADYFGLNHYTSFMVSYRPDSEPRQPSLWEDMGINVWSDPSWTNSSLSWLKVVPEGFRSLLGWIKNEYNNPEIIVTENGFSDLGGLEDEGRINYHQKYLNAMLEAIHEDNVNVTGYTVWCLLDNFEWTEGYTQRFGLYSVDFESEEKTRTPKSSAKFYKGVTSSKCLTDEEN